ncbi:MAG: hypothetical protein OEZ13_05785 [Spirochaetia bacterium]|nr:hypothetical protein [Spirochaetia bacterium]
MKRNKQKYKLALILCSLLTAESIYGEQIEKHSNTNEYTVDYKGPNDKEDQGSPFAAAFLDLIIPGYGMFKTEEYEWGIWYISLKAVGAFWAYNLYNDYLYKNSIYKAADIKQKNEPGTLYFFDPVYKNESYSATELKSRAESALLLFAYSIIFETAIFAISSYHSYKNAFKESKSGVPFYNLKIDESNNVSKIRKNTYIVIGWKKAFYI